MTPSNLDDFGACACCGGRGDECECEREVVLIHDPAASNLRTDGLNVYRECT